MNGVSFAILALGLWLRQILFVNNLDLVVVFVQQHKVLIAEFFYYITYGSSIITSKIPSIGVSRTIIVCFGILFHLLSWKTIETPKFMFSLLRFFD